MPSVAPEQLVTLQISVMGTSISVSVPRECIEPGSKSQAKLYKVLKENLNQAGTAFLSPENAEKSIQAQLERVFVNLPIYLIDQEVIALDCCCLSQLNSKRNHDYDYDSYLG